MLSTNQSRACSVQLHLITHTFKDDWEPDFESHPGIEEVPTILIAAVTHSGRDTAAKAPLVEEENLWTVEKQKPWNHLWDSRTMIQALAETGRKTEEDILPDIAPVGGWCSPAIKELWSLCGMNWSFTMVKALILPKKICADVFQHFHASPIL
jgi:hypothetical protein